VEVECIHGKGLCVESRTGRSLSSRWALKETLSTQRLEVALLLLLLLLLQLLLSRLELSGTQSL